MQRRRLIASLLEESLVVEARFDNVAAVEIDTHVGVGQSVFLTSSPLQLLTSSLPFFLFFITLLIP